MKRLFLFITIIAITLSCVRREDEHYCNSEELSDRLTALENKIPNIDKQIEEISSSISDLEQLSEALKQQIAELEKSADATAEEIETLNAKSQELYNLIQNLYAHVEYLSSSTIDWGSATFATLEQYEELLSLLEALKQSSNVLDAAIIDRIETDIQSLNAKIVDLENRLSAVEANIQKLLARIQSITYIPEYIDGKATLNLVGKTSEVTLDFKISPKECVAELEKVWGKTVSCEAIHAKTRSVTPIPMPITRFSVDKENGIITVLASGENLSNEVLTGSQQAMIALTISDGNNSVTSEYIPLVVNEIFDEIWYTSTDGNVVKPTNANVFGANITSNTYINGKGVITFDADISSIGQRAFLEQSTLSTIAIPNKVTDIDDYAFRRTKLSSINLPTATTHIGTFAFSEAMLIKEIEIPNSVENIESGAFIYTRIENFYGKFTTEDHKCLIVDNKLIRLAQVGGEYTLPEGINVLGKGSLTSLQRDIAITIPQSVQTIESMAVTSSYNITAFKGKYASDDGLSLIKDGVLYGVAGNNMTSYTVPDGVKTINSLLFQNLNKLESVVFSSSVTKIQATIFPGCNSLKYIRLQSTTPPAASKNIFLHSGEENDSEGTDGKIPDIYVPAKSLNDYKDSQYWSAYADYIKPYGEEYSIITYTSTDEKIIEPYETQGFGANIVSNTYENGIGTITFDGEIISIPTSAFREQNPYRLKTITIPNSVKSIGESAFNRCQALIEVNLGDNITSIGNNAFMNCGNLPSITIPNSVEKIGSGVFIYTDKLANFYGKFATADNKCLIVNKKLLRLAQVSGEYTLPEGITTLGRGSLTTFTQPIAITLPQSLEHIESLALTSLRNVTAFYGKFTTDDHFMVIYNGVLHGVAWAGLTGDVLDIPEGVTTIDQLLCQGGINTPTIILPKTTTTIRSSSLKTSTLKRLYCKATTPPSFDSTVFASDNTPQIYVPQESVEAYKTAKGWKNHANYIFGYDF